MDTFTPEILGILAIWLLAVVSPGPAFLMLSRMAAGRSRTAALGTALGIALGALLFAALSVWGLAELVTRIGWIGTVLRIVGALYLVYLGLTLFHSAAGPEAQDEAPSAASDFAAGLRVGLATALTNPKAIAFFVSLFAVALPHDLTLGTKVALLAAGFAIEMGWYTVVALLLSAEWLRSRYAAARKTIERVLGSALLLAGVRLGMDH